MNDPLRIKPIKPIETQPQPIETMEEILNGLPSMQHSVYMSKEDANAAEDAAYKRLVGYLVRNPLNENEEKGEEDEDDEEEDEVD